MEELEISGKRYISTRRAAREHGYHSDYMGQLIRNKKVKGQKVGRSWYIEEGSLNAYLGHAAPAPEPAPVAEAPAPAPVEQVVVEAPAVAPAPAPVPAPQPVHYAVAPQPLYAAPQPVAPAPVMPAEVVAPVMQPAAPVAPAHAPVQEYALPQQGYIEHPPLEEATRIPINTHAPVQRAYQEPVHGGLRYAEDDAPSLPTMTKMPQQPQYYAEQYAPAPAPAPRAAFPYIGLSVIAGIALVASIFASNFITATIVSEEGKAASVQYSIHW